MRKLRLFPLITATYFMVSGGPYGLEDAVGAVGYRGALLLIVLLPVLWSLPTALMVGELASAIPAEGGFYVWVTRALGPFWGFQEAWLSLAASIFDMAIYPALAVSYLAQLSPALVAGHLGFLWSIAIIVLCVGWNLRGAAAVGTGSAWLFVMLLLPFAAICVLALLVVLHPSLPYTHATAIQHSPQWSLALLVLMWNTMGWDQASTIAREVEKPHRTYIRAMLGAVAAVIVSYAVPVCAIALARIPPEHFATGAWVGAARTLTAGHHGSALLPDALIAGGVLTGLAMFNALTLSYARLPAAMATDRLLPSALAMHSRTGVPWVAVLACGIAWAAVSGLSFERLIELDILVYGLSLILEFVALVVLRAREPHLHRPFRIPGGTVFVGIISAVPTALVLIALYIDRSEHIALLGREIPVLVFGAAVVFAGWLAYAGARLSHFGSDSASSSAR